MAIPERVRFPNTFGEMSSQHEGSIPSPLIFIFVHATFSHAPISKGWCKHELANEYDVSGGRIVNVIIWESGCEQGSIPKRRLWSVGPGQV